MKILMVNPILYTSENSPVKKVKSIKDTMIYNLCLAFKKEGYDITLVAAEDYKPLNNEQYDFNIIFLKTKLKKIFKPHCLPYLVGLKEIVNNEKFNFIITSEVFSINSLYLSIKYKKKTIVWHELAKHNKILYQIPSKIWYNIFARIFFRDTRIVPRSKNAYDFIVKYCNNVSNRFIDHGVDLDKFKFNRYKKDYFVVLSQLIKRKRIDGIINAFRKINAKQYKLIIIGDGPEKESLNKLCVSIGIEKKVIFKDFLPHNEVIPIIANAKALLVNTIKDNNMVSIVESIAVGTPVLTTNIPYNSTYIKNEKLGIVVNHQISFNDLEKIIKENEEYIENCYKYRKNISNKFHVEQFIEEYKILGE